MSNDKQSQPTEQQVASQENELVNPGDLQSYQEQTDKNVELDPNFKAPAELLKAQHLANVLDSAVKIPLINFRVGLDFLIGLVPGIGDSIMLFASLRIIYLGHKMGVPGPLKYKMTRNAIIDYGLGFVPIIGDIVDMFFKANLRNVRIIETWWVSQNKAQIDALAKHQLDTWHKAQNKT